MKDIKDITQILYRISVKAGVLPLSFWHSPTYGPCAGICLSGAGIHRPSGGGLLRRPRDLPPGGSGTVSRNRQIAGDGTPHGDHDGGSGRGSGISEWWQAFKGTKENEPGNQGNQIAGIDVLVTLPFKAQPVQLYLEAAGEDQATFLGIPYFTKKAYLAGVFLPTLFGSPRADFRAEFAQNHIQDYGPAWYVHGTSGEGHAHRYRGEILGHPMGTDAWNFFIEGHYFLLPSSYIEANFDLTRRYSPGPEREETRTATAAFVGWFTRNLRAEWRMAFGDVKNENGTPGADSTDASIRLTAAYQVMSCPNITRREPTSAPA